MSSSPAPLQDEAGGGTIEVAPSPPFAPTLRDAEATATVTIEAGGGAKGGVEKTDHDVAVTVEPTEVTMKLAALPKPPPPPSPRAKPTQGT